MMNRENGNVLFLILIAVALFAALSYAVTQSTRGGGDSSKEKGGIDASVIFQSASTLASTVSRLRIMNGCSDIELSFLYDSDGDNTVETNGDDLFYNPNAPTDYSCDLFNANGGGLTHSQLGTGDNSRGWFFSGAFRLVGVGVANDQELLSFFSVNEETCKAINRELGLPESPLGAFWYDKNHGFDGVYYNLNTMLSGGGVNTPFEGHYQGCLEHTQPTWAYGDTHFYYHALIER